MPLHAIFHEADAFTFDSMSNHYSRFVGGDVAQRSEQLGVVMSVYFMDCAAEGP